MTRVPSVCLSQHRKSLPSPNDKGSVTIGKNPDQHGNQQPGGGGLKRGRVPESLSPESGGKGGLLRGNVPPAQLLLLPGDGRFCAGGTKGSRALWGPAYVSGPASSLLRGYLMLIKQTAHKKKQLYQIGLKRPGRSGAPL